MVICNKKGGSQQLLEEQDPSSTKAPGEAVQGHEEARLG